jgi:hypothetical protein
MRKDGSIIGVSFRLGILAGLLFLTAFLYAVFYMLAPFWGEHDRAARFQKTLLEYDALFEASRGTSGGSSKTGSYLRNYALLERKLISIEKQNENLSFSTFQTTLSLLKRERAFSQYDKNFRARYERTLLAAGEKYPETVQLRALVLESTLKNGLPTVSDALNIGDGHGQFAETVVSALAQSYDGEKRERLLVDAALLSIITDREYRDTSAVLYPLDLQQAVSVNTFRFAAEYAYDAGNFPLASRLFAALPYDNSLERAGDALFLGSDHDGARELWLLSADANSLYNYALWSEDAAVRTDALEKLLALEPELSDPAFSGGLMLYTRLQNDERAAATLGTSPHTAKTPLLDLELWRRTEKNYAPSRALAEMWLLIGRHLQDSALYEYAAWYFGRERQDEELALLLKNAALQGIDNRMLQYWRIMLDTQTGDNKTCREALAALRYASSDQPWYIAANIGRIYEAERSWKNAADHYYTALANAVENHDKSRILQRLAACHTAQGRNGEARGALEEAVYLDPSNLNARSALNNGRF